MNCKPDDVCIIVGAERGQEANIGAFVTVTQLTNEFDTDLPIWVWADASRALIFELITRGGYWISMNRNVRVLNPRTHQARLGLFDHHLIPLPKLRDASDEEGIIKISDHVKIEVKLEPVSMP